MCLISSAIFFFFFNDTATTEIYTLSLHDALPICWQKELPPLDSKTELAWVQAGKLPADQVRFCPADAASPAERIVLHSGSRSEEHTSELQSRQYLVCRLLLEKKKKRSSRTGAVYL